MNKFLPPQEEQQELEEPSEPSPEKQGAAQTDGELPHEAQLQAGVGADTQADQEVPGQVQAQVQAQAQTQVHVQAQTQAQALPLVQAEASTEHQTPGEVEEQVLSQLQEQVREQNVSEEVKGIVGILGKTRGKRRLEDCRRKQTFYLSNEEIEMLNKTADFTGKSKYLLVGLGIRCLYELLLESHDVKRMVDLIRETLQKD